MRHHLLLILKNGLPHPSFTLFSFWALNSSRVLQSSEHYLKPFPLQPEKAKCPSPPTPRSSPPSSSSAIKYFTAGDVSGGRGGGGRRKEGYYGDHERRFSIGDWRPKRFGGRFQSPGTIPKRRRYRQRHIIACISCGSSLIHPNP